MKSDSRWVAIGALFGMLAVIFGAFAAHGLKNSLSVESLSIFQTAAHYQMIHALALVGLGLWSDRHPSPRICWTGLCFTLGILLFSGSLFALSLTGHRNFGMITPMGGMFFIIGWLLFALEGLKAR
jgi:uncharacterized membrane protein YgdD (TMEM256/DUF423 family)